MQICFMAKSSKLACKFEGILKYIRTHQKHKTVTLHIIYYDGIFRRAYEASIKNIIILGCIFKQL